jgi:hypothetical protein
MLKHKRLFLVLAFTLLLIGIVLAVGAAGALPMSLADTPGPLPNDCQGVTEEGEPPPVCCAFGYVYYDGVPVDGAQVTIQGPAGSFNTTTSTGPAATDAYYRVSLSASPLSVSPGDTITVTATYSDSTASTVYQVVTKGQQVDVVIPMAGGSQPPIGTINYIHPNPATQGTDTVAFAGSGVDGDEDGASIAAWEWVSNLDGVLSVQEDFLRAASSLSAGTHTVSFRVQDDEGNWSGAVVRTLEVEAPFTEHFTTYTYKDTANTTADWNVFDGVLKLPRQSNAARQTSPSVAVDAAGNSYVVWQDDRNDGDIYAQKYDTNGNRLWSADVRVNSDSGAFGQEYSVIVLDAAGNAFVIWQDGRDTFGGIYAQKINPDGHKLWAGDKQVDDGVVNAFPRNPAAALDPGTGDIVVVWEDSRNGNEDIYAQRLDPDGNPRWTADVRVNTDSSTTGQHWPAVGVDAAGNTYVVWHDDRNGDPDIWAQKLNLAGYRLWIDLRVNSDSGTASQAYPAIATDAGGYSYIVWNDYRDCTGQGYCPASVYAQKVDANRNKQWPEDKLVDSGSDLFPAIALSGNGSAFIVTWTRCPDLWCNEDIYAQKFNADGNPLWQSSVRVNSDTGSAEQYSPAITMSTGGDIRVAWQDNRNTPSATNAYEDIYMQRLDAAGNRLWGNDVRVNSDVGTVNMTPAIATDPDGNSHVAWGDGRNSFPDLNVYAQKLNTIGNPQWRYDLRVNRAHSGYWSLWSRPSIAVNLTGAMAVTWGDGGDIYAQTLRADGTRLWPDDVCVNSDPPGNSQYNPAVTMDTGGNLYIVWQDYRNDASYPDIYIQKLDPSGIKQWAEDRRVNTDTVTVTQSYPAIAFDDYSDTLYVVWEDERNGHSDIYAQRLDLDGNQLWAEDLQVNSDSGTAGQHSPTVAAAGGDAYIAWHDYRNGGGNVYAQKVASDGGKQWVGDVLIGVGLSPAVVTSSTGYSYIVWETWNNGNQDIYAQRLDPAGNKVWPAEVRVNSDDGWTNQYNPSVSVDTEGNVHIVWEDHRRGSPDIYAQKLLPDGTKAWAGDIRINPDLYLATAEARSLPVDDTSGNITWATLTVSQTLPSGTAVAYFLSNNGGAAWTKVTPGVQHTIDTTGSDLRWRAILMASGDQTDTPVIDWVRIEYSGASTPGLSINDVTVVEGDAGTVNAVFTVSLSPASGQQVTVDYATANGTATAGSDYVAASGTLTFPIGSTTQNITVEVIGDTLYEGPYETFSVTLSSPINATIEGGEGVGTIDDDDPSPQIKTLILTNEARLRSLYDASDVSQLMSKLDQLAAHNSSEQGLVVQVEDDPAVAAAYVAWDADPTSTTKANAVTAAIRDVIAAQWTAHPDLEYLVIVGDDRVIPFRRVLDQTRYPESNYDYVSCTSVTGAALCDDMTLTDDFYTDRLPAVPDSCWYNPDGTYECWDGHALYIPDLGTGRLIETPDEIVAQIDVLLADDGLLSTGSAIVTGYDFVKDGAQAMCNELTDDGITTDCTLIGEYWDRDDFIAKVLNTRHGIASINGHADHYIIGCPSDRVYSSDVAGATANHTQAIFYTVGCHSGLNVPPTNPYEPLDTAQALVQHQINYIANTGYGWGYVYSVGLSEQLMLDFTEYLVYGQSATLGQALAAAKQEYYLNEANFNYYDEKIMIESTLYGLPMYRYTTPTAMTTRLEAQGQGHGATAIKEEQVTVLGDGLTVNSISYQFPALTAESTDDGLYYTFGGLVHTGDGEPIQPKYTADLSFPETKAHGVVFKSGVYTDATPFDPVVAQAINEYVSQAEPSFDAPGWYPALLHRLNRLEQGDNLVTLLGQFNAQNQTERVYDKLGFDIYYHTSSDDWVAPTIVSVSSTTNASATDITVKCTDASGIYKVIIAYTANDGHWHSTDLAWDSELGMWTGSIPTTASIEYLVQVIDNAGNVAAVPGSWYRVYLPLILGNWSVQ